MGRRREGHARGRPAAAHGAAKARVRRIWLRKDSEDLRGDQLGSPKPHVHRDWALFRPVSALAARSVPQRNKDCSAARVAATDVVGAVATATCLQRMWSTASPVSLAWQVNVLYCARGEAPRCGASQQRIAHRMGGVHGTTSWDMNGRLQLRQARQPSRNSARRDAAVRREAAGRQMRPPGRCERWPDHAARCTSRHSYSACEAQTPLLFMPRSRKRPPLLLTRCSFACRWSQTAGNLPRLAASATTAM